MKMNNKTSYDAAFLRALITWTCQQIGVSTQSFDEARISTSHSMTSRAQGWHTNHSMGCRIRLWIRNGTDLTSHEALRDIIVEVACAAHWASFGSILNTGSEIVDDITAAFEGERHALVEEWSKKKPSKKKTISKTEHRVERATELLAEWERKEALARTKCKKYRGMLKRATRARIAELEGLKQPSERKTRRKIIL